MTVVRSTLLYVLADLAEIGGAWPVRQGVREHRGSAWIGADGLVGAPVASATVSDSP